jgi:tetratricopeptide (TPR) repeat protein
MCNNASFVANSADPENTTTIQNGHWVVPFDQNEGFVGRDDIMPDLLVRVSPDHQKNACQRTVLEGLGGIGKSQIALEAAFRLQIIDPACSIFWVPALSTISFESAYRDIAKKLGIQHADNERSNTVSLVKQALSNQQMGKWLLIVDNADDPSLMFESGSLASYLPSSPQGSILFTTRTSEITSLLDVPSVGIFRIDAMSPQESMDLMGTRLSTSQMEDVESLHLLLEELFHLPLAIKQAAAYMQQTRETPKKYLGLCQASDKNLIRLLSEGFEDRTRHKDAENPVAKTWLISFVHLSNNNPLASHYIHFMSFLSEKNIPLSILPPQDEIEANRAIGALQAYGFITAREDKEFVDMHRLVRLAIRNWLEDRGEDKESYEHVQARMLVLCDVTNHRNQTQWAIYIPHCHTVVDEDALSTSAQATWCLLVAFSQALLLRGFWKAALDLSRRAKDLGMAIYDPNDLHQIDFMSNYAASLMVVGHRNEAEGIFRETLPRQERAFGKYHHKTLQSRRLLGILLLMGGQYKETEKMYLELLQETERVLGKGHEQTILTACDLCNTLWALGRYTEVETIARQLLVQSRSILGDQQSTTFMIMSKLADLLTGLQRFQEAEELIRQAIKTAEIMLGKKHPKTLSITGSLASILYQSGQLLLAEELSRKLVKAQERILGKEDPETLQSADTLAATLCALDRFLEAEEIYRDNLEGYQRLFGEEHHETISAATFLGSCLRLAGKHGEAAEVLQQTIETSSRVLGESHTYTARCLKELNLIPNEFHPARSDPESHPTA